LILACDGLWDVMTHDQAADFVHKARQAGQNPEEVARALVFEALRKKTDDNVTVIVVYIDSLTPQTTTTVITEAPTGQTNTGDTEMTVDDSASNEEPGQ